MSKVKFSYVPDKDQLNSFKNEVRNLILEEMKDKHFTQTQLARILETNQPRVSNLVNSVNLDIFSLEMLLGYLAILRPGAISINIKPLKVK